MNTNKLMRLARMVLRFATTMVGETEWIHDGPLSVGTEVYTEDEKGELIPVADGEYETENMKIVVKDGKIEELNEITPEPEPEPEPEPTPEPATEPQEPATEPQPDEKDTKIAELEAKVTEMQALIDEKDAKINELEAKITELEDKLVKPVETPIEMKATPKEKTVNSSGALKFFQD